MKKDKEWFKQQMVRNYPSQSEIDNPDYEIIAKVKIIDEVLSLIDQVNEPELPAIPRFVADWIELAKDVGLTLVGVMDFDTITVYKTYPKVEFQKLKDYMAYGGAQKIVARAWIDGYTIEPEPMYLVKVNDQGSCLYLKSMQLYKDVESRTDLNSNFEAWKEKAIKFTNKEQAEGIAKFFNGEVVEVTNNA